MAKPKIYDISSLFDQIAKKFAAIAGRRIKSTGRFSVALCGGSTPIGLYGALTSGEFREAVEWDKIDFFIGDERDVSPESVRSNYHTANVELFRPLGIEPARIHRWPTEIIDVEEVAGKYEQSIIRFFDLEKGSFPRFDLVFLGLGEDGHTASLFPHTAGIDEKNRIAIANRVDKLDTNRLTLTLPVFNNAAKIIFMAAGRSKAAALREVLEGENNCHRTPARCIQLHSGSVEWFADKEAAGLLK